VDNDDDLTRPEKYIPPPPGIIFDMVEMNTKPEQWPLPQPGIILGMEEKNGKECVQELNNEDIEMVDEFTISASTVPGPNNLKTPKKNTTSPPEVFWVNKNNKFDAPEEVTPPSLKFLWNNEEEERNAGEEREPLQGGFPGPSDVDSPPSPPEGARYGKGEQNQKRQKLSQEKGKMVIVGSLAYSRKRMVQKQTPQFYLADRDTVSSVLSEFEAHEHRYQTESHAMTKNPTNKFAAQSAINNEDGIENFGWLRTVHKAGRSREMLVAQKQTASIARLLTATELSGIIEKRIHEGIACIRKREKAETQLEAKQKGLISDVVPSKKKGKEVIRNDSTSGTSPPMNNKRKFPAVGGRALNSEKQKHQQKGIPPLQFRKERGPMGLMQAEEKRDLEGNLSTQWSLKLPKYSESLERVLVD
jgi:murein DD-endopeptidase MepM/ murein hydrolase activator NlpD